MPEAGLEPAQPKDRGILSPLRLPNSATPAVDFKEFLENWLGILYTIQEENTGA